MSSQVHQNYNAQSEDGVNSLVNQFLCATHAYLSLGFYFSWDNVALSKFVSFSQHPSEEKHEQAEKLMTFQNHCGGKVVLQDVKKTEQDEWGNGVPAIAFTLQPEKRVNQTLLDLHPITSRYMDPHMCDFLETHYIDEEVKLIMRLGDHLTNLKRVRASEDGLGEYLFDGLTLGQSSD